jgi:hypothetical protein
VRVLLYDYRFADARSPGVQRQWWERRLDGSYYPSVTLEDLTSARARLGGNALRALQ